jgi:hypothetical protein
LRSSSGASLLQIGARFGRFKVLLDFFQRLAFGFRQEEHRDNKGNHCAACPEEEHRGIPKVTNRRQARINDLLIRNPIASFIGMLRSLALWIIRSRPTPNAETKKPHEHDAQAAGQGGLLSFIKA